MKIKLDNVLKRGGIIFRTHGSEMPCLSFQALRVVYPRKSKVELWYGGEDVQEEVIETLDGQLNYREVAIAFRNNETLQPQTLIFMRWKLKVCRGFGKKFFVSAFTKNIER